MNPIRRTSNLEAILVICAVVAIVTGCILA